jgi:hypothetical protein
MADIFNILASNFRTVGSSVSTPGSKYVNVDADAFQGRWSGKYAKGQAFTITVSNISGFRAKVKYQSAGVVKYQDVLIRDNAFRIGDSKFTLARSGVALIKTVLTDPASGGQTLETAYAQQD